MLKVKMEIKDADLPNEVISAAGFEHWPDGRTLNYVYFIHKGVSPVTLHDALDFVRKTFFFQPHGVWVDGKRLM